MPAGSKEINTTVSSLRTDRIIAIGLNVPRRWALYIVVKECTIFSMPAGYHFSRLIWEIFMDGRVMLNGRKVKKSAIVSANDKACI